MKWFHKYTVAFEQSYDNVPKETKEEVKNKLKKYSKKEKPVVSIVAIAHNEGSRIFACLWSLADNIISDSAELIVVSNHSTDRTNEILEEMEVCWYDEIQKGPGFARQCGLNHANGIYHICIDTDTLYPPHYIQTHIDYLRKPNIVCTYGLWSFMPSNFKNKIALFFYQTLRDIYLYVLNINRPELCVRGMVMAFRTEEGKQLKYNTRIIRGEDGSMALGLKSKGKLKFIVSKRARVITSNSTIKGHGGVFQNFLIRLARGIKRIPSLFTQKKVYEDKPYNIIK